MRLGRLAVWGGVVQRVAVTLALAAETVVAARLLMLLQGELAWNAC